MAFFRGSFYIFDSMQILTNKQIDQKIKRLAIEILENNLNEKELILAGINNNGMHFAQLLMNAILEITKKDITITRIKLNPAKPISEEVIIEMPIKDLNKKVLIVIDDVANTGRTIFYAFKPLMDSLLKKIEVAVLVDRTHKSFPIKVDYCGQELATTLQQNIVVKIQEEKKAVFLE